MDSNYRMKLSSNFNEIMRFESSDYLFFFVGELSIKLVDKNSFVLNSATNLLDYYDIQPNQSLLKGMIRQLKLTNPHLTQIYQIGFWNNEVEIEEQENVTKYLLKKFKILPIFLEQHEIQTIKTACELLNYLCYNKEDKLRYTFLQNSSHLEKTWDFLRTYNRIVQKAYLKLIDTLSLEVKFQIKKILVFMHEIYLLLPKIL